MTRACCRLSLTKSSVLRNAQPPSWTPQRLSRSLVPAAGPATHQLGIHQPVQLQPPVHLAAVARHLLFLLLGQVVVLLLHGTALLHLVPAQPLPDLKHTVLALASHVDRLTRGAKTVLK